MAYTTEELGRLIARAHYQAWRLDAPPFDLTPEELAAILPNLIRSGSAGIVWHRVKPVRERYGAMAYALEAATEAQIAHNLKVEEAVVECVTRLRAYGIEPVLIKGLAFAKLYPAGIIRPAGDIDLVVREEDSHRAKSLLSDMYHKVDVDLQSDSSWFDHPASGYQDRLETVIAGGIPVSVLGARDRISVQCLHLIRHGGRRALWLTDIGLALDVQSPSFAQVLECWKDRTRARWTEDILAIATQLLGASWNTPNGAPLPWLPEEVSRQWWETDPFPSEALREVRSAPHRILWTFQRRWPPPIRAFWILNLPFSNWPLLAVQLAAYTKLIATYAIFRLPVQLKSSPVSMSRAALPEKTD